MAYRHVKYFKLSTTDANYKALIAECEKRHVALCPGNKLSVRLTEDKETALVKVVGADPEWCVTAGLYTKSQEEKQIVDETGKEQTVLVPVYTKETRILSEYSRVSIDTFKTEVKDDAKWNPSLTKGVSRE